MQDPSLEIVIVNFRTADLVVACLNSLAGDVEGRSGRRVTVVDNASGDGSSRVIAAAIKERGWSDWAQLISSRVNGGFAAGNNLAIRAALARPVPPDFFWLLNPDTLVDPGAPDELAAFMAMHPQVGILGGAIREEDGEPWPFAFSFPSILGEVERGARVGAITRWRGSRAALRRMGDRACLVDWVSGASMMIRRDVFGSIGLMDDRYFLYYEETDFCWQARRAGWEIWYLPGGTVTHYAGRSTGLTARNRAPARVPQYWFQSRRRFFVKNRGHLYAALADLAWLVSAATWRVRQRLMARPVAEPPLLMTDFLRNSAIFAGRRA